MMINVLLVILVSVTPAQIVSSEMARCPDATYMDFREGRKLWDYATGLELKAFLDACSQEACSPEAFDYAESWYDAMICDDGAPYGYKLEKYNIDHICPGRTLIPLYKATGKEKYLKALRLLHLQLCNQPRTAEGGYWHKGIYPDQIWLDGLYMGEPFLVEYAAAFEPEEIFREACAESVRQFLTAAKVTYDPVTGLLRHAYDSSRRMFWCNPVTGQSEHCWARALGWYCMAAVEVLGIIPEDTPGRDSLVMELRRIVSILPRYADKKSGMWYQVMDQPGRKGNYLEASSSAMFTYTILKGVRLGVLDASLEDYGLNCWENLLKAFVTVDKEGLISLNNCCTVGGLGGGSNRKGDFTYYISEPIKSNDPKGMGPFLWAALEIDKRYSDERKMTERGLFDAIRENPYRAGGGLHIYEVPRIEDTPAPKGYKPFYISHLSRHGSRTQTGMKPFKCLAILDSLQAIGLLTASGDSLLYELHQIEGIHKGNTGMLTDVGKLEQSGVGYRLAHRYPDVFRQKESGVVACSSTEVPRCRMSMEAFSTALKSEFPMADLHCSVGLNLDNLDYPQDKALIPHSQVLSEISSSQKKFLAYMPQPDSLMLRILVDPDGFATQMGTKLNEFFFKVFDAASGAQCLGESIDPLRFFTTDELYNFWRVVNIGFSYKYGTASSYRTKRTPSANKMIRLIIRDADAAIAGGNHCADLRFAHDGNLAPLLNSLGVEGFDRDTPDDSTFLYWQSWKHMCMCSNLQMIFYRNKGGEVLVKLLRNERETYIPALVPVQGPYYRWKDLRRYMLYKSGDIRSLPVGSKAYLQEKAALISELQKSESDGFWFITDMHFPDNCGLAAPALEYIQSICAERKLFFGGDMIASVHDMKEGLLPQNSAFMQIKGVSELFLLRGNHDITTHTGKKPWPLETLPQNETVEWFRSMSSPGAVYGNDGLYYYVDNPSSRIRYVAFESTDSVKDGKIKYGTSPKQLDWIQKEAVESLPKGWKLLFLSHMPLYAGYKGGKVMEGARNIVEKASSKCGVLMVLSGHRHTDLETRIGSILQVVSQCDGFVDDSILGGSSFDYVSISRDRSKITMVRVGRGENRHFVL